MTTDDTYEGPNPSLYERISDERYANDIEALATVFRMELEGQRVTPTSFGRKLHDLYRLMVGYREAPAAILPLAVFEDYGAVGVLTALLRAYKDPAIVRIDTVEHE